MRVPLLALLVGAISLAGCSCDPCAPRRCAKPCPPPCPPPCAAPRPPPCGSIAGTPQAGSRMLVMSGEGGVITLKGEGVVIQGEGAMKAGDGQGMVFVLEGKEGEGLRIVPGPGTPGAPAGAGGQGMVIVIREGKEGEEKEGKEGNEGKEEKEGKEGAALPPAIRQAVETLVPGGTVKEVETGKRDGHAVYEVEIVAGGKTTEVVLDEAGKALQWEIEIDPATAPKAVLDAAQGAAKGKVTGVAEIRGADKVLREYQVDLKDGEVEYEVRVSLDGKVLKVDRDQD